MRFEAAPISRGNVFIVRHELVGSGLFGIRRREEIRFGRVMGQGSLDVNGLAAHRFVQVRGGIEVWITATAHAALDGVHLEIGGGRK